jgi:hypothetical protein
LRGLVDPKDEEFHLLQVSEFKGVVGS